MNNIWKRKLSLSKRHIRRISDKTNIDIARCSKEANICIEDFSDSDEVVKIEIVNENIDAFDINSTIVNEIDNDILSSNEYANHYEQCETNVTRDNDHNSYNVITDKTRDDTEFKSAIAI